jgi:hypothetical protein
MGLEEQLCLLLARRCSPEAEQKARQLLTASLAWEHFFGLVRAHEILPLVYCRLKSLGFASVPQPVQFELAERFRRNALRNSLLADELARILSALAEAEVSAIPLKGVPLAESLYGDSALRVCADIDILVPPPQFVPAFQILQAAGYQSEFSRLQLVKLTARYGKDLVLMRQEGMCWFPLQLHAGLFWGGPLERALANEIWSKARPTAFHEVPGFSLNPEWQFLYLAIHAARHGLSPLKFLVDIDRLCADATISWEAVQEKAGMLGWSKPIDSVLEACGNLLDTSIPTAFTRSVASGHPVISKASRPPVSNAPATLPDTSGSSLQILREMRFSMGLLSSRWQKLQYAAIRIFVPTALDCRSLPLPGPLFFLYYIWRPLRLAFTISGWLIAAVSSHSHNRISKSRPATRE